MASLARTPTASTTASLCPTVTLSNPDDGTTTTLSSDLQSKILYNLTLLYGPTPLKPLAFQTRTSTSRSPPTSSHHNPFHSTSRLSLSSTTSSSSSSSSSSRCTVLLARAPPSAKDSLEEIRGRRASRARMEDVCVPVFVSRPCGSEGEALRCLVGMTADAVERVEKGRRWRGDVPPVRV